MVALDQLIESIRDGKYISPVHTNKVLIPQARSATDCLIKFLGYQGIPGKDSAGNGKFDVNSPAMQLASAKIPSYQINTSIVLTSAEIKEALASATIYADDTLDNNLLKDTIEIKKCDGSEGGLDKNLSTQNAGRRVIISTDYIVNDNYFNPLTQPVKVKTIAACAPNLSNTGWNVNNIQRDQFVTNDVLDETKYKEEMKSRAELILNAMHAQGVTHPIIPAIGAGDFAGDFSEKCANLTAQAFIEVLKMGKYPNFKGVVFSVPSSGKVNLNKEFNNVVAKYQGSTPVIVTDKEMTSVAIEIGRHPGNLPGYVMADHPTRRPGNGWAVNENGTGASAQEETCTKHLSCYLLAQSHELNKNLLQNIQKVKLTYPSKLQSISPKVEISPIALPDKEIADKKTQEEILLEPKKESLDELMKLLSNINIKEKYRNANVKKKFSFAYYKIFQHHDRKAQIRHLEIAVSSAIALLKQDMTRNAFEVLETTIENIAQDLKKEREQGHRKLGDSRMEKVIMDLHREVEKIKSHLPTPSKNKP